jgi:hypothetical protein
VARWLALGDARLAAGDRPGLRRAFLEAVPEHRRAIALP